MMGNKTPEQMKLLENASRAIVRGMVAIDADDALLLAFGVIAQNAGFHAKRWAAQDADKMQERWWGVLVEEIAELSNARRGTHEHPVELELIQIGSICANWLARIEQKYPGKVLAALERALKEHSERASKEQQ